MRHEQVRASVERVAQEHGWSEVARPDRIAREAEIEPEPGVRTEPLLVHARDPEAIAAAAAGLAREVVHPGQLEGARGVHRRRPPELEARAEPTDRRIAGRGGGGLVA